MKQNYTILWAIPLGAALPFRLVSIISLEITKLVANLCLFSHMFVFDKCSVQAEGVLEELIPYLCTIERLMCEVEFFGRCCV